MSNIRNVEKYCILTVGSIPKNVKLWNPREKKNGLEIN
jgi:hypothetical protein